MKCFNQFRALFCILAAALVLGACTLESSSAAVEPAETSQPPQSDLEAILQVPTTLPDGDSVELEFTLINHSETGLYVLKWYTPLEGLKGEIFRIERDEQVIPYEGPLVMRGDPTPDAYVFLDAGASVSATVDLAAAGETGIPAYDFSEPGAYTIAFISPRISYVARTEDQMVASVDDLGPVQIRSNRVTIRIGNSNPIEPSTTTLSTSEPLPPSTTPIPTKGAESGITIMGTVMDTSLSARIVMLKEPVEGFSVIALTEESELVSADRSEIALRDILPGVTIKAFGQPGESNALIASQVLVLDATPTPPPD